nr:MAG TPA: hypothetical protein [Caudoviricetes sp.]
MFFVGNIVSLLCSLKRPLCGKKKKLRPKRSQLIICIIPNCFYNS